MFGSVGSGRTMGGRRDGRRLAIPSAQGPQSSSPTHIQVLAAEMVSSAFSGKALAFSLGPAARETDAAMDFALKPRAVAEACPLAGDCCFAALTALLIRPLRVS